MIINIIPIIIPIIILLVISSILLTKNYLKVKKTEKKLQDTIKLLYTTQKQTNTGSWLSDLSNEKTFWTNEVYRIHGLQPKITKEDMSPYIQKSLQCYDKEKQDEILSKFSLCKEKGISYEGIYKFTDFKGKQKWVKTGAEPIIKNEKIISILGYLKDVTQEVSDKNELLKAKKIAEDKEARFRHLFENNPVALIEEDLSVFEALLSTIPLTVNMENYLDKNPSFIVKCASKINFLQINKSALKVFGYNTREELIKHLASSFNEKSFETIRRFVLSRRRNEKSFIEETEYKRKDGSIINAIIHIFSFNELSKCIIAIIDISKQKQTEIELATKYKELQTSQEKLRTANKELIIAKEQAEESDHLKSMFIQNMSHEIRTPMNGIIGFSSLLSTAPTENEFNQYVKIIQNSSNQLLRIIDDILEISKLGTNQVKSIEEKINLNELLLDLFSIFEPKAKDKKLSLYLKTELSDLDSNIITDSCKLHKILSNLLENALKFTNIGFVEFGYSIHQRNLELFVKDTGIGVNQDKQQIIFKRFIQEDKDVSVKTGGLGLGLAIAKENAELLGGKIGLISTKNKGSNFIVSIPFKPVNPDLIHEKINISDKKYETQVLIAEDEDVNYTFLETLIEKKFGHEYKVLHAKNGQEAVDICKNTNIALVLMDIKMPVMNGIDATKEIKKFNPSIQIIAQTAYSTNEDKEIAFSVGCDDFISKPINPANFITILNKHIHQLL